MNLQICPRTNDLDGGGYLPLNQDSKTYSHGFARGIARRYYNGDEVSGPFEKYARTSGGF